MNSRMKTKKIMRRKMKTKRMKNNF